MIYACVRVSVYACSRVWCLGQLSFYMHARVCVFVRVCACWCVDLKMEFVFVLSHSNFLNILFLLLSSSQFVCGDRH